MAQLLFFEVKISVLAISLANRLFYATWMLVRLLAFFSLLLNGIIVHVLLILILDIKPLEKSVKIEMFKIIWAQG